MPRALKILAALLSLLLAALLLIPYLIDPGDIKAEIERRISAATGRELTIAGDLSWSLFPWPGLEVTGIALANAPGVGPEPLAEIDRARLHVRLLALVRGQLEFDGVRIEGVRLNLIRDGQGLVVEELTLTTGPVVPGEPVEVDLSARIKGYDTGTEVPVVAAATLAADSTPRRFLLDPLTVRVEAHRVTDGIEAEGDLSARLEGNLTAGRYLLDGVETRFGLTGAALSDGRVAGEATARIDLDLAAQTLAVTGLEVRSGTLVIDGEGQGRELLSNPRAEGRLAVRELDLRAWTRQAGLPPLPTPDPAALTRAAMHAVWGLEPERVVLQGLVVSLDQTRIEGRATMLRTSPPGFRFDLTADTLDLDRYLAMTAERPKAATPAVNTESTARQASPTPTPPAPPREKPSPETAPTEATPAPDARPGPSSPPLLSTLDEDGRLRIGELRLAGLVFGDADLNIKAKDGAISVENQIQGFYQGRLTGRVGLDLRGAKPGISLNQQGVGVEAVALIAALTGEDRLSGRSDFSADLSSSGWQVDELRRRLAGTLAVHVTGGSVQGFNLERTVREAEARLKGKPPPTNLPLQTDFSELTASGEIASGVLSNEDLRAASDHLHLTGKGRVDIGNQRFDYRFEPVFVKPPQGRGIKELEGIPIPVHLTGTFQQPSWRVDIGAALREAGKRELQKRIDEGGGDLLKQIEERTGIKGIEQGLRGLFGR